MLIVDLNHPVWGAEPIIGRLSDDKGRYCPLGKLKKVVLDCNEVLVDFNPYNTIPNYLDIYEMNDGAACFAVHRGISKHDLGIMSNPDLKVRHKYALEMLINTLKSMPDKFKLIDKKQKSVVRSKRTSKKENLMMGSVIRKERENQGLSQGELSRKAGVPRTTITDLENGTHTTRFDNLAKVVRALSSNR